MPLGSGTSAHTDHDVEGAVGMMLDATSDCAKPLNTESLLGWHRALSPIGYNLPWENGGMMPRTSAGPMAEHRMVNGYELVRPVQTSECCSTLHQVTIAF